MDIQKIQLLVDSEELTEARQSILADLDEDRFSNSMAVASSFNQIKTVASRMFIPDDSSFEEQGKPSWDYSYWTDICVELSNNFSVEKLEHAIEVMTYLRKQGDPKFSPNHPVKTAEARSKYSQDKSSTETDSRTDYAKWGGVGAVAGGVVGVVAKGAASVAVSHILIGATVGAIVGVTACKVIKSNS